MYVVVVVVVLKNVFCFCSTEAEKKRKIQIYFSPKTRLSPSLAGAAKLIGFVPNAACLLRVGHRMGDVLVILIPIKPCSSARIECQPAIPVE